MSKIRILVVNPPEEVNGITWWRVFRPLTLLQQAHPEIEVRYNPGQLFPHDFLNADIVFAYRTSNPQHAPVLSLAKELGCKVVVDWDDDELNIPLGHPALRLSVGKARYLNECLALADEVWTSTDELRKVYEAANRSFLNQHRHENPLFGEPGFTVVKNAVLQSDLPDRANGNTKFAVWRGHEMHRDDIEQYRSQYSQILKSVKVFMWHLYMPHWGNHDVGTQVSYSPDYIPTNRWPAMLRNYRPSLLWKPLLNNQFNKSKSNISWLEATCAGGICLTNFAGEPEWEHCTKEIPKLDEYYIHLWQKSAEAICNHYDLRAWNEVRYRQILKLVNG